MNSKTPRQCRKRLREAIKTLDDLRVFMNKYRERNRETIGFAEKELIAFFETYGREIRGDMRLSEQELLAYNIDQVVYQAESKFCLDALYYGIASKKERWQIVTGDTPSRTAGAIATGIFIIVLIIYSIIRL